MPTVERRSLPHSLSAVATKGRRLFTRDSVSTDPQSLRASALNLNEALEQAWVTNTSPLCLSNQLLSPQPSTQSHSWGLDNTFGRRRSSNTTTASSTSSTGETPQRRRKSLFSKKQRTETLVDEAIQENTHSDAPCFVDPFASRSRDDPPPDVPLDPPQRDSSRQKQRQSTQQKEQQKKKEALERISDLVCLSVQSEAQLPSDLVGASSPNLGDSTYFYPIEAPPSPTSMHSGSDTSARRASIVAFPARLDATRGLRVHMGGDEGEAASWPSQISPSLSTFSTRTDASWLAKVDMREEMVDPYELLLPSSMKRQSSRTVESEVNKKSFASLRAELGHGVEGYPFAIRANASGPLSQASAGWWSSEAIQPSLQPLPPLRPVRNPMRSRSKSLCSSSRSLKDSPSSSPPPPVPALPSASSTGLVGPYNLTPVNTPPRSRPTSQHRGRGRCDSLTSAASTSSLQNAPFHTPTFGSSWTRLPV
ncbi:hypothetical protein PHBOTO_004482 [Pseudozyma hubeiensis]|nr:hypothetical protein PHBOTO_004482 [Pseudozyma hubeiensis]